MAYAFTRRAGLDPPHAEYAGYRDGGSRPALRAVALLAAGVIERTAEGKLLFPCRHVEVRFKLDAAA